MHWLDLSSYHFCHKGTLNQHSKGKKERYPSAVEEIKKSLYVDDVFTGGKATEKASKLKESAITVFWRSTVWLTQVALKWARVRSRRQETATPRNNLKSVNSYAKEEPEVKLEKPRCWGYHGTNQRHSHCHILRGLPRRIQERNDAVPCFTLWPTWSSFTRITCGETFTSRSLWSTPPTGPESTQGRRKAVEEIWEEPSRPRFGRL